MIRADSDTRSGNRGGGGPLARLLRRGQPAYHRNARQLDEERGYPPFAPPRRILVVKLFALGDMLNITPALRALRARYPEARIDVLATRGGAVGLGRSPYVDDVFIFDKSLFDSVSGSLSPRALLVGLRFAIDLRRRRYDTLVLLHHLVTGWGTLKYLALALWSGAATRVGLDNGRGWFLTHRVRDRGFGAIDERRYWLAVVAALDTRSDDDRPHFTVTEADRAAGRAPAGRAAGRRADRRHPPDEWQLRARQTVAAGALRRRRRPPGARVGGAARTGRDRAGGDRAGSGAADRALPRSRRAHRSPHAGRSPRPCGAADRQRQRGRASGGGARGAGPGPLRPIERPCLGTVGDRARRPPGGHGAASPVARDARDRGAERRAAGSLPLHWFRAGEPGGLPALRLPGPDRRRSRRAPCRGAPGARRLSPAPRRVGGLKRASGSRRRLIDGRARTSAMARGLRRRSSSAEGRARC